MAAALEREGIATVALQFLKEVAVRVRPPRALLVPFPHGYALGRPQEPALQHRVLVAAAAMLARPGPPPLLDCFDPTGVAPVTHAP